MSTKTQLKTNKNPLGKPGVAGQAVKPGVAGQAVKPETKKAVKPGVAGQAVKPETKEAVKPGVAGQAVKPETKEAVKPLDDKAPRKGAPVGTSNEVFIELLPDERISRHKALAMIREMGLSCSQARMAQIIEMKYGPAPERKGKPALSASKLEKEKARKEAEEKALALVRAKREAAKKGEPVEGYKAEVYVAPKDTKPSEDTK